jgi:hypothetical protein
MTLPASGSTYHQELEQVIDLFRKLREAVFATKWSNNDLEFSIQGMCILFGYLSNAIILKWHQFSLRAIVHILCVGW